MGAYVTNFNLTMQELPLRPSIIKMNKKNSIYFLLFSRSLEEYTLADRIKLFKVEKPRSGYYKNLSFS